MAFAQLIDIYNEKGEEFLKNLFNLEVTITEKVSGFSFCFELKDEKFIFYKRNNDSPISKVERMIMKAYDEPINFFNALPKEIVDQIPEKTFFCLEYFPNKKPNYILYDRYPKNKLILTHIVENGKTNNDSEVINSWASILHVSSIPTIFQGYLSDDQKEKLYSYLRMTKEDIQRRFNTDSFTKFIISILNPELKQTLLQDNLEKPIDAVIFQFKNNDSKVYAKLIDPVFSKIIESNKKEQIQKNDMLPIIFSNIIEFVEVELDNFAKLRFNSVDTEDKYIELICKMFNKFIQVYGKKYEFLDMHLPAFMKKPEFDLNIELIQNQKTFELVNTNQSYKQLLKIFLALFRKKKNRSEEFLSPSVKKFQNSLVDRINNAIKQEEVVTESEFPTFNEFLSTSDYDSIYEVENINEIEFSEQTEEIKESIETSLDDMRIMNVVSFWQNALTTEKKVRESKKQKEVTLVIDRFQPIHNGHIKTIKEIYSQYKKPVILMKLKRSSDFIDEDLSKEIFEKVVENTKCIKEIYEIKNAKLKHILSTIGDKYKPTTIVVAEGISNSIKKELEYDIFEDNLNLDYKIEFAEFYHHLNKEDKKFARSKDIVKLIEEDKYNDFKKVMPDYMHNYFEKLKQILKNDRS